MRAALCAGLAWALFGLSLSWLDPERLASPPESWTGWLNRWPPLLMLVEVLTVSIVLADVVVLLTVWGLRGRVMRPLDYAGVALIVTTFMALVGWTWARVPVLGGALAAGHLAWWTLAVACVVRALRRPAAADPEPGNVR